MTIQYDREAAADLAHALGVSCEDFTSGAADILVQAFTAHREAEKRRIVEWQPIETAPKDGTRIIAARIGWCHSADRPIEDIFNKPQNEYRVLFAITAQFDARRDKWTDGLEVIRQPTHWQPLQTPEPAFGPNGCGGSVEGWYCTREAGHEGPCAAIPTAAAIEAGAHHDT